MKKILSGFLYFYCIVTAYGQNETMSSNTGPQVAYAGFDSKRFAYEAVKESVNDFNKAASDKPAGIFSSLNWKKIKKLTIQNDASVPEGFLMIGYIGDAGDVQSGYVIYTVDYKADSKNLNISCVEMLKIPGVVKNNYERSRFEQFKNLNQVGVTTDETYHKHATLILTEIVTRLDKYKNNPEFVKQVDQKLAKEEEIKKERQLQSEESRKRHENIKENNKMLFTLANQEILKFEEGELLCLTLHSDFIDSRETTSDIAAYVEKYNASKTKLQIRIHNISADPSLNTYENVGFTKGDLIWINLPMPNARKYWTKCH